MFARENPNVYLAFELSSPITELYELREGGGTRVGLASKKRESRPDCPRSGAQKPVDSFDIRTFLNPSRRNRGGGRLLRGLLREGYRFMN